MIRDLTAALLLGLCTFGTLSISGCTPPAPPAEEPAVEEPAAEETPAEEAPAEEKPAEEAPM